MRFAPVLLAAMAGLAVTADLAEAQRHDRGRGPSITLYDQPNYQGRSVVIDTDAENLDWLNFNDMASSIRVSGGQWEVCIDASYRGTCQVIDSDLPNMSQWASMTGSARSVPFMTRVAVAGRATTASRSGPDRTSRAAASP